MIQRLARIFSAMFSPMIMPTYGIFITLWTTILCINPIRTRFIVVAAMFAITFILPVLLISLLFSLKILNDRNLIDREERLWPYICFTVCFVGSLWYLKSVNSPLWLMAAMFGVIIATLISFAVNSLLKWKISAHMAGIGGIIGMVFIYHHFHLLAFNMFWPLCIFVIIAGLLGSARLILNRHTLLQVFAGFVNGLASTTVSMMLIIE